MKNTLLKNIAAAALAILMTAVFAPVWVYGQTAEKEFSADAAEDFGSRYSIEGVWQTTITPVNCQTGAPVAPPFYGLLTFNEGGTLAETASNTPPSLRSPGHGIWRRGWGRGRYQMSITALRFNPANALIGSLKVRQEIELSRTGNFSSTGTVEVIDLNNTVIANLCTTSTATRFE